MILSQMHFKYDVLYKKDLAFYILLSVVVVVIVDTTHSTKKQKEYI